MFQVPTAPANISKGCRVFCRLSAWSIGRRSFGKLPASFRSRKLWLTSARLFYRDGFFSLRTFVSPGSNFTVVFMCIAHLDVTDARSCVCVCMCTQTCVHTGACILRASIPPGACGGIVSVSTLTDEIAAKTNAYLQRFSIYRIHNCELCFTMRDLGKYESNEMRELESRVLRNASTLPLFYLKHKMTWSDKVIIQWYSQGGLGG